MRVKKTQFIQRSPRRKAVLTDSSKDSSSSAGENETYDLISQLQEQMQDSGDTEEKDPDYYTGLVNDETLVEKLKKGGVQFKAEVPDTAGSLITELVITVVPIILMVLLFAFFYEADDQRRRYDGHRKEQCQDVYGEADRSHIPECCRTG